MEMENGHEIKLFNEVNFERFITGTIYDDRKRLEEQLVKKFTAELVKEFEPKIRYIVAKAALSISKHMDIERNGSVLTLRLDMGDSDAT